MKQKAITIALLALMSTALLFTVSLPILPASGQLGLYIYEVTARDSFTQIQNATVGQPITLVATIATENGTYNVYYNDKLVDTGKAQQHFVSSNITVPEILGGTYNFTLTDVTINQNTTYPFPILTQYQVTPTVPTAPSQLQESGSVVLNVTVTGGTANTAYNAEIMIVLPSPLSTNYTKVVSMTSSAVGTAQALVTYPDASFSPSSSSTLFTGIYQVYFNQTQGLATSQFTVGFTDLTSYHRGDTVKVRALGYSPAQSAILDITFNNAVIFTQNITASDQGVITASWSVPNTATIGPYSVRISASSAKAVQDVQTFQVPGYPITFRALNLAGEIVPGVVIEAYDVAANQTYSGTTSYLGEAEINLEKGSATVTAYLTQVKVGEITTAITGNAINSITCQLTDLTIKVQDKNGVAIPFVSLKMSYQYVTRAGVTQTGTGEGQTDLTGKFTFNSTLTGINYAVDASKYNKVFNAGNNTISKLPATPTSTAIIICPDETVTLKVVDYSSAALPNARITLIEQASGIFYSVTTDSNGAAQVTVTFGQYRATVYSDSNIQLTSTVITVTSSTQSQIRCAIYKLPISVKIVDYFGTPISNIDIQLSRTGMTTVSGTTTSDGTATFNNVIGGTMEVTAYPSGNQNNFVATTLQVDSPTTITLSMNKYVVFGGSLIETSLLATIILIVVVIVLLIIVEIFRRTGFKLPTKTKTA